MARASHWSCSLNVKDSDFGVTSTRDDFTIIRVWHEFHGEDVTAMTSVNGGGKVELFGGIFWLVRVEVDLLVVGARCEELAGFRPTIRVISTAHSLKLVQVRTLKR